LTRASILVSCDARGSAPRLGRKPERREKMGFFSSLSGSFKKSKNLRKLQMRISPPNQTIEDITSNVMASLKSGRDDQKEAVKEFLDLCINDEGVKKVMSEYSLSRGDLERIYINLNINGLGQWIKGHQAALSTIAYYEPLLFHVESERRGEPYMQIVSSLLAYWEGRIPQRGLLKALR
jgi:hypothetical protein